MNVTLTRTLTLTLTPTLTLTLLLFDPLVVQVSDARLRPEWAALSDEDAAHTAWKAPEVLLASFATSALLLDDAEGGGAAGAPADFSLASVTERADLYAFAITCYEVARVRGRGRG